MKRPCYVPSKNYKVRVIAKKKVLNKLNIKTIVSISSSVIAARGASRGPRRVALIGRSPFLFFFALSHRRLSRLLHMPQGFAAVLLAAASVLPAFFFFLLVFLFSAHPLCLPPVSTRCKRCNFSLQWENRYNGGERDGLFNKGIRAKRRDERGKKGGAGGSTLGAEKRANVHTQPCA